MSTNAEPEVEPKVEEPKAEEPKAEESKPEESKVEEAEVEEVKPEETKPEEAKPDEKKSLTDRIYEGIGGALTCGGDVSSILQENMKSAAVFKWSISTSAKAEPASENKEEQDTPEEVKIEVKTEVKEGGKPDEANEAPSAPVVEEISPEEELKALKEELALKDQRIESLQKTKATLIDTIENSAKKLMPSVIAAKDMRITVLNQDLAASRKETAEAREAAEKTAKDIAEVISSFKDVLAGKDEELEARARQLDDKDKIIEGHLEDIAAAIQAATDAQSAHEALAAEKDAELADKDKIIEGHLETIAAAAQATADAKSAHEALVAEKDAELDDKNMIIRGHEETIAAAAQAAADARSAHEALVAKKDAEIAESEQAETEEIAAPTKEEEPEFFDANEGEVPVVASVDSPAVEDPTVDERDDTDVATPAVTETEEVATPAVTAEEVAAPTTEEEEPESCEANEGKALVVTSVVSPAVEDPAVDERDDTEVVTPAVTAE